MTAKTKEPKKILIITHEHKTLGQMVEALRQQGHDVTGVTDVFTCLDTLVEQTPDIIFLDLIMPQIDGDELCRIFRKMDHLQKCYIVILSVITAEREFDYGTLGADACIAWGPFKLMLPHVLQAVEDSRTPRQPPRNPQILGGDTLHSRRITKVLLEQNHHLTVILEGLSQGILELSGERVVYANKKAIEIIGREKEKLLGVRLDDISGFVQLSSLLLADDSPLQIAGRQIVVEHFVITGAVQNTIIILSDITEKKQMEAVIEATNLAENLGYVFSGIRHEIGNPVNSIKIALSVLQRNLAEYDIKTTAEFIDRSLQEVSRIEYLLKALKNYSLFEKPNLQKFSIVSFAENFLALIREDFEHRRIQFQTFLPQESIDVYADSRALHHIMLNILTNAADAVEGAADPRIIIGIKKSTNQVTIKVDDNGKGISEEEKRNLFKPFITTKTNGTGLGLVIVKKMLDSMNCKIHIESYQDIGTTVTLGIPLSSTPVDA